MLSTVILTISLGISFILMKEITFSMLSRESSLSYYAADVALECALSVDSSFVNPDTGIGIFPYDINPLHEASTTINNMSAHVGVSDFKNIYCATAPIFDSDVSGFSVASYDGGMYGQGITSSYNMRMDLGAGAFRCAKVIVNKTPNYRQIISRGYNSCITSGKTLLERAVINTTIF